MKIARAKAGSPRRKRFTRAAALVEKNIRAAGESRGFAVSRLLTHWDEIAGSDMAAIARPVRVSYARSGFGATLELLTTGAQAPMLEMQSETLKGRINACYGYAAISRIRITQTAPTGFAEGQAQFGPAPRAAATAGPDPETRTPARDAAAHVGDDGLRRALETLGQNVLTAERRKQGRQT